MLRKLCDRWKAKADRNQGLLRFSKLAVMNTILLLIAWSGFFREGFGEDTLSFYFTEDSAYMNLHSAFEFGRYVRYGVSLVLQKIGFYPEEHYKAVFLLFLLTCALAAAIVQTDFETQWRTGGLWTRIVDACVLMPFVSGLFADTLGFPEISMYSGFCYLLGALAFHAMTRRKWLAGLVLGTAAIGMYQTSVVMVPLWFFAWDYADHDGRIRLKPLRDRIPAVIAILGPALIDGGIMAILEKTGRTQSSKSFTLPEFRWMLRDLAYLIYSFFVKHMWLTPALCFPLILMAVSAGLLALVCRKSGGWKRLIDGAGFFFIEYLAGFSFAFVMGGGLGYPGRMSFLLWCACGMILLACGMIYLRETDPGENIVSKGLWPVLALMLAVFFFFDGQIAVNHAVSNAEDVHNAKLVLQKIRNYEEETGNTVTYLTVLKDALVNPEYEDVYYTYCSLNTRSMGLTTISLLNYVSQPERRFLPKDDEVPEEMAQYAHDNDWDSFDPDRQVILDGDRVYWVIY